LMHVMTGDVLSDTDEVIKKKEASKGPRSSKQVESEKTVEPKKSEESEAKRSKSQKGKGKGKRKGRVKSLPIVIDSEDEHFSAIEGPSSTLLKPQVGPELNTDDHLDAVTTDNDHFDYSDISLRESASDMYETNISVRPPSSCAGDSSTSSLVDYESTGDEMVVGTLIDLNIRHKPDPQALIDIDAEMETDPRTEDPGQQSQEMRETGLKRGKWEAGGRVFGLSFLPSGSDMKAKKRAREASSPRAAVSKPMRLPTSRVEVGKSYPSRVSRQVGD
ncbi:hypothetical protein EST38_g4369, partial [Candolleomyces aberdarensis]